MLALFAMDSFEPTFLPELFQEQPEIHHMEQEDTRADTMIQTYIDLQVLAEAHEDHEGSGLMGVLIQLEEALREAREKLVPEISGERRSGPVLEVIRATRDIAARGAALNLLDTCYRLEELIEGEDQETLSSQAVSLLGVWLGIAATTRSVCIATFELSLQLGRAPNGKIIRT